jgi:hypothetical protein
MTIVASIIRSNIRLFELSDNVKSEIKAGDRLILKGEDSEDAVLCSSKTTYAIKKVEMSNEIYLVTSSDSQKETDYTITAGASHYYEVSVYANTININCFICIITPSCCSFTRSLAKWRS